jgi:hypothetical protein
MGVSHVPFCQLWAVDLGPPLPFCILMPPFPFAANKVRTQFYKDGVAKFHQLAKEFAEAISEINRYEFVGQIE